MYLTISHRFCALFLGLALLILPVLVAGTPAAVTQEATDPCSKDLRTGDDGSQGEGFWSRPQMLGDWCGLRSSLAKRGIITDVQLTQFYQDVTDGGTTQTSKYGGKIDYNVTVLGEQAGLWKKFTVIIHAETQVGKAIVGESGAFVLPNVNMLYPFPGDENTAITALVLMQELNEKFSLVVGKINMIDLWNMIYPYSGRGCDGFMNLNSLTTGLPWFRFVPQSFNGGGLLVMNGRQIQGGALVFDTNNSSTTVGINNLFDKGFNALALWRLFTNWGGKPGSHLFLGGWSSRDYTSLDKNSWTFIPGQDGGLTPGKKDGAWTISYFFEQVLWAHRCEENRNLQLLTGCALSDGNPSFARWNGMASLQATGVFDCRKKDKMGIAYFYTKISKDLRELVRPLFKLTKLQGAEFYYRAAITPWYHMTANLQVIDNADDAEDTAIILGLRSNIIF